MQTNILLLKHVFLYIILDSLLENLSNRTPKLGWNDVT